jgi:hypothetical protein
MNRHREKPTAYIALDERVSKRRQCDGGKGKGNDIVMLIQLEVQGSIDLTSLVRFTQRARQP